MGGGEGINNGFLPAEENHLVLLNSSGAKTRLIHDGGTWRLANEARFISDNYMADNYIKADNYICAALRHFKLTI